MVEGLVELFQSLSLPQRKTVQGLWAELYLVKEAVDPASMVAGWHCSPTQRYDFASGIERIEVKSAAGRERKHHFALEQLTPPAGAIVLIASLCLERTSGGTSLRVLLQTIRYRLQSSPKVALRVELIVGETLGDALSEALDDTFDEQLAAASLAFYRASDVPRPSGTVPTEVTEVRFVASLENTDPIDSPPNSPGVGGLFSAWGRWGEFGGRVASG